MRKHEVSSIFLLLFALHSMTAIGDKKKKTNLISLENIHLNNGKQSTKRANKIRKKTGHEPYLYQNRLFARSNASLKIYEKNGKLKSKFLPSSGRPVKTNIKIKEVKVGSKDYKKICSSFNCMENSKFFSIYFDIDPKANADDSNGATVKILVDSNFRPVHNTLLTLGWSGGLVLMNDTHILDPKRLQDSTSLKF